MPLQKFRDKQKLIYWVVAIIVIPSFVLLGFTQFFVKNPGSGSVGSIYGEACSEAEYQGFHKRMLALSGSRPITFTLDGYRPSFGSRMSVFVYMTLFKSAQKYGIEVSDEEVNTFIRYQFNYQGDSAQELQNLIKKAIGKLIRLDSVFEYRQAVYEWLMARKFLGALDSSIIIPQTLGFNSFAQAKATYKYRSLTIPAEKFTEAAAKEIDALPAEQMQGRIAGFITNNQKPSKRNMYSWLWTNPQWKFDYIFAPFVVPDLEPKITEEKLQDYYNQNKASYTENGKEKTFAEIREKVETDYRKQARRANASQTIDQEFGRFLRRAVSAHKGKPNETFVLTVEQISSDPRLVSLGMKAGVSDEKAIDSATIMQNPVFAKSSLPFALSNLESTLEMAKNKGGEEYENLLKSYKGTFHGMSYASMGGGANEMPISGENGLYKIRLIEYIPAEPISLESATAEQKKTIEDNIRQELVNELAMEKAKAAAVAATEEMAKGAEEIDGIKVETKDSTYLRLQGQAAVLINAPIGKVFEPAPSSNPKGYQLLQLVERKIPQPSMNEAVADSLSTQRMWRGNSDYSIESSMNPVIKIGARFFAFYIQLSNEKQIEASNLLLDD